MKGFVKLIRNEKVMELMRDYPKVFILLTQIALRADRQTGVARVGDYSSIGLTRAEYRTTIKIAIKLHILTIKTTNKGTLATLCNSDIYDINKEGEQPAKQPAPPRNSTIKTTTNKKYKEKKGQELEIIY